MSYTTKTAVQNYLLTNIDVSFDAQLTEYIAAMSEYIDRQAGYPIYTATSSTRTYDGNGYGTMLIDPVHTISQVLVDTVQPDVAVLLKAPYNSTIKNELILKAGVFTLDLANVTVTGVHCLAATLPEQVKWACTVLVAGIVNHVNNQTEGISSEKIGDYAVTYNTAFGRKDFDRVLEIISSYRRLAF